MPPGEIDAPPAAAVPEKASAEIEAWLGSDAADLPALPLVAVELMTLVNDPETACERLAEIVVREPVLAARILRLVNSAYFGLSQKVTDIRHAVFLLGYRSVRTVAMTAAVFSAFKGAETGRFDLQRFWRHNISAAAVMRTLAKRCGTFDAETAFALGLLHDLGKLMIARYRRDDCSQIIDLAEEKGLTFHEAEQEVVAFPHAAVGAWLARRWALPDVLVEGIAAHHDTHEGAAEPLHGAIQFANYLCAVKGITTSGFAGRPTISREVWLALGLDPADLPPLIDVINEEIQTAESILASAA